MKKFLSPILIIVISFLVVSPKKVDARDQNSSTFDPRISNNCSITYYYADGNGKYIGDTKTLAPGANYQLKARWKEGTCLTLGAVKIGWLAYDEKTVTVKANLNTCIGFNSFSSESGYKIAYYNVSGDQVKEGNKVSNFITALGSSAVCKDTDPKVWEYQSTSSSTEIFTTVKKATAGNTTTTTGGNTNTNNANAPKPRTNANTDVGIGGYKDYDSAELGSFFNPLRAETLPQVITSIIRILLLLIASAAVIMIIVGGFRMVIGGGNPTMREQGKKTVIWAIIGLVVALMSFSIVAVVQSLIQK